MPRFTYTMALLVCSASALACEPAPPAQSWVLSHDRNQDGQLDAHEWSSTQADGFVLRFRPGDSAEFQRLDKNQDGFLSWDKDELWQSIDYTENPCAGWPW
ncbi:EF-hand domain-containing protein [Snodgrassella sp. CFCC 13594]|uniref:EF-hand domain-containing protein n=1 Tax=Snodgrassella sp. CFCC 13594 TaxID=1775559 RepID=UPI000830EB54|nr:EF-hand domain-containing protein [Snodgrassella sp. CFCC 13594]